MSARHAVIPLSKAKVRANRAKSRIRARIEHVFGAQETAPGGRLVRTIGIVRARAKIGLQNFVYNIRRLVTLERIAAACRLESDFTDRNQPPGRSRRLGSNGKSRDLSFSRSRHPRNQINRGALLLPFRTHPGTVRAGTAAAHGAQDP
jgi:hypothetical protein